MEAGLNLYAYCDGDPVGRVDPLGLDWIIGSEDRPLLVFTTAGTAAGLKTGAAAVGSAFSFGLYDGGCYKNQPGFGESRFLAGVGRDALIAAGTAGAGQAYRASRTAQAALRAQQAARAAAAARLAANRAAGNAIEARLAALIGGASQKAFNTPLGKRVVDQLVGGAAHEVQNPPEN